MPTAPPTRARFRRSSAGCSPAPMSLSVRASCRAVAPTTWSCTAARATRCSRCSCGSASVRSTPTSATATRRSGATRSHSSTGRSRASRSRRCSTSARCDLGLRVVEIPSFEASRIHGVSNLQTVRDGFRVVRAIGRRVEARATESSARRAARAVCPCGASAPGGSRGGAGTRSMTSDAAVSVVVCAYTMDRWGDLCAAVDSLLVQTVPPIEIVVVIDHNPELLARARIELSGGQRHREHGCEGPLRRSQHRHRGDHRRRGRVPRRRRGGRSGLDRTTRRAVPQPRCRRGRRSGRAALGCAPAGLASSGVRLGRGVHVRGPPRGRR